MTELAWLLAAATGLSVVLLAILGCFAVADERRERRVNRAVDVAVETAPLPVVHRFLGDEGVPDATVAMPVVPLSQTFEDVLLNRDRPAA